MGKREKERERERERSYFLLKCYKRECDTKQVWEKVGSKIALKKFHTASQPS